MNDEIELSKRKCLPCEGGIDAINHEKAKKHIMKKQEGVDYHENSRKSNTITRLAEI